MQRGGRSSSRADGREQVLCGAQDASPCPESEEPSSPRGEGELSPRRGVDFSTGGREQSQLELHTLVSMLVASPPTALIKQRMEGKEIYLKTPKEWARSRLDKGENPHLPAKALTADAVECADCRVWRACAEWFADLFDGDDADRFTCKLLYPGRKKTDGCGHPVGPDDWRPGEAA